MKAVMNVAPGAHVSCGGVHYVITHLLSLETVLAKNQESGKSEPLKIADLLPYEREHQSGEEEVKELSSIPDEEWDEAGRWREILEPLLNVPRRTRDMVEKIAQNVGVHATTIYRKLARLNQTGRTSSLQPLARDGGKGRSRLGEEREAILQHVLSTEYQDKPKLDIERIYKVLQGAYKAAGLRPPHKNTLIHRINAIKKNRERLGTGDAGTRRAAYPGHFPGGDFPLAVAQIDHTKFDVMVVDDRDREPIGRPWVTLMIDVFSRMVLGYHISLDPPNSMSVALCVVNAILPKEKTLDQFGIKNPWPCWGKMAMIHADNAGEFRGKVLGRACEEYGIDLEWRPVKKPHYGAHVERLLCTILKKVHSIAGTTFSNIAERGEYDSEGNAVMTMSEFEHWFLLYITGVYHQHVHSALNRPPIKQYEAGILGTEEVPGRGLPQKITDEDLLLLDLMPYEERTIQEYGVVIEHVHYFSDVLRRWVNEPDPANPTWKRKFIFKQHPNDISVIYFFDPEIRQYFRVPYRNTSHPPMSIWEFRRARRRLIEMGKTEVDEDMIFESYAQMRALEEKAARETKRTRRERQRRTNNQKFARPKTADDFHDNFRDDNRSYDVEKFAAIPPFEEREEL